MRAVDVEVGASYRAHWPVRRSRLVKHGAVTDHLIQLPHHLLRASWRVVLYTPCAGPVPPRPRRAGSRPGRLSARLAAALAAEAKALGAHADPLKRIEAVNDFYAQLDFELEQIANIRLQAIQELRREGWSYDRLAAATTLSKARVAQLAQGVRGRRRRSAQQD